MSEKGFIDVDKIPVSGFTIQEPLIHNNVFYIGSADTYFYALDAETGKELWAFKTADRILYGGITIYNDILYFGSMDGYVYGLDLEGKEKWRFRAGAGIVSKPIIQKDIIYFGCRDGFFYAVDIETKEILWMFQTGMEILCNPILHENKIYFGSTNGFFYCIDLNGNLVWKYQTGGPIPPGSPDIGNGNVYFSSFDKNLYCLTLDGKFKWYFQTADESFNAVLFKENKVYFCSRDQFLYCLDSETGICEWRFFHSLNHSRVTISNGVIYTSGKILYALNKDGSKVLWEASFTGEKTVSSVALVHNNKIIFGSHDGYIRAFDISYGKEVWQFKVKLDGPKLFQIKGFIPPPSFDPTSFEKGIKPKKTKLEAFTINSKGNVYEVTPGKTRTTYGEMGDSLYLATFKYKDREREKREEKQKKPWLKDTKELLYK